MRERFRHDWHFLLIALTTMLAGLNFMVNPGILDDRTTYAFIVNLLDDLAFSIPMFILGLSGSILFIFGKKQFRTIYLVGFRFIWMVMFLAYFWRALSSFPNTTWVLALCLNTAIFLSALWGDDYAR